MPSKGKRVASRQGNLRRRRSSANRSNASASSQPTAAANPPSTLTAAGSAGATATATAPAGAGVSQAIGRPRAQPRGRRFDRPAAYNHVRSELVRISIFAGVLLVALVAISFLI